MSDPTLTSLALLEDPTRFRKVENVPIFRPHVRKDARGKELYKVTEDMIPDIAQRCQALEAESGVVARMGLGHIKPGEPQTSQPPLVGFVGKARAGTFGPKQKPAVLATLYYRTEDWDEAKKYPFRSAEFYPNRGTITGLALLKTDPELDLGMLIFDAEDRPQMYVRQDEPAEPAAALPGTTTVVSTMPDPIAKPDNLVTLERVQALETQLATYERERAETSRQIDALVTMNKAQGEQITTLQRQNVLVTYERDLEALHRDLVFDLDEEKKLIADYTPEQFARHKTIMQRYEKRPHNVMGVGPNGTVTAAPASGSRQPTRKEQAEAVSLATKEVEGGRLGPLVAYEVCERAVMLATDKGLTFDAALAEVKPKR